MRNWMARAVFIAALALGAAAGPAAQRPEAVRKAMPTYQHFFLIIDENKGYHQLMDHPEWTPVIHRLAAEYGSATQFYAEVHSSEANYIAMLGGDTFGIHDDDAFYCHAGVKEVGCEKTAE